MSVEKPVHGIDRGRRLPVDGEDQITRTQASRGGGPAFRKARDQDARRHREAEAPSQLPIDRLRLPGEAEVAADDPSVAQQLGHHPFRGINGHGKAE